MVKSRAELLEAVSVMPPQELVHLCDRARVDFKGATESVVYHGLPMEKKRLHTDEFLRLRVAGKTGPEGLSLWDQFVKLVDSQPMAWRYPEPEEGEM